MGEIDLTPPAAASAPGSILGGLPEIRRIANTSAVNLSEQSHVSGQPVVYLTNILWAGSYVPASPGIVLVRVEGFAAYGAADGYHSAYYISNTLSIATDSTGFSSTDLVDGEFVIDLVSQDLATVSFEDTVEYSSNVAGIETPGVYNWPPLFYCEIAGAASAGVSDGVKIAAVHATTGLPLITENGAGAGADLTGTFSFPTLFQLDSIGLSAASQASAPGSIDESPPAAASAPGSHDESPPAAASAPGSLTP